MNKQAVYKVKGMCRDTSESAFNSEYAFDIKNLRLTALENTTQLSLETEKGNSLVTIIDSTSSTVPPATLTITGSVIGQAQFADCIVLFTTTNSRDFIYKIFIENNVVKGTTIYNNGILNFNTNNPIETLPLCEREDVKKVYWTDGINQPRLLNIEKTYTAPAVSDTQFDFLPTLALGESITVVRNNTGDGMFPGGTLQYCITYSKKYGQESAVAWVSPLLYTSFEDRAVSPEEYSKASYTITIQTPDTNFDYINLYSIIRTSEDGVPVVRLVIKANTTGTITLKDTNTTGEIVDSTSLLYKGGEKLSCYTMVAKDNTLFLGNLVTKTNVLDKNLLPNDQAHFSISNGTGRTLGKSYESSTFYNYTPPQVAANPPTVPSNEFKYLKKGNFYRIGVQFQDIYGKWSTPLFLQDYQATQNPSLDANGKIVVPTYNITLTNAVVTPSGGTSFYPFDKLRAEGYRKVRPVIVYPSATKRTVIAQGVVCPTVFTPEQRMNNAPYAQSSWYFRPYNLDDGYTGDTNKISVEGRHLHALGFSDSYNGELQYMDPSVIGSGSRYADTTTLPNPDSKAKNFYYVDNSIIDFYSPELDDLDKHDVLDSSFRIIGYISIDSASGTYDIAASATSYSQGLGVIKDCNLYKLSGESKDNILATKTMWHDGHITARLVPTTGYFYYAIYPWHKSGKIGAQQMIDTETIQGDLQSKIEANIRISQRFTYLNSYWSLNNNITNIDINNGDISDISSLNTQLNANYKYAYSNLVYLGGIDNIYVPVLSSTSDGYRIFKSTTKNGTLTEDILDNTAIKSSDGIRVKYRSTKHAVFGLNHYSNGRNRQLPIPFKSQTSFEKINSAYTGIPFWLNSNGSAASQLTIQMVADGTQDLKTIIVQQPQQSRFINSGDICGILAGFEQEPNKMYLYRCSWTATQPTESDITVEDYDGSTNIDSIKVVYIESSGTLVPSSIFSQNTMYYASAEIETSTEHYKITAENMDDIISVPSAQKEIMWLGEFYRSNIISGSDVFGDYNNNYLMNQCQWVPAGAAAIIPDSQTSSTSIILPITSGDTIFDRWDCIKTLPVSSEDPNQLVDILSFMCETYKDIEGRYDKNRGKTDNTTTTELNFNKFNSAYESKNNYFSYRIPFGSEESQVSRKYQVAYSLTKTLGEDTDSWTNIQLSSILDLDGDKGDITALRRLNNNILAFQQRGISRILYNENVQIASTAGVPIEIANSGKVQGKNYISDSIGCYNKWSICTTPNGLYFIDSVTQDIYCINESLRNLSQEKGFHTVVKDSMSSTTAWSPSIWNDCLTLYDPTTRDIMFVTNNKCLVFNEALGEFSSFYDYSNINSIGILNNNSFVTKTSTTQGQTTTTEIWKQRGGNYCQFFGEYKPYWVKYLVNPEANIDKVFSNLEISADSFDNTGKLLAQDAPFDLLRVTNEYQDTGEVGLGMFRASSNLKRKFRTWRVTIPRDSIYTRDRIRNKWAFITLKKKCTLGQGINRTVLHNTLIDYFY